MTWPPVLFVAVPQQVADTVVAMPGRDGFDLIFGVAAGIIGVTFLAVLLVLLFVLLQTRHIARAVTDARRRLSQDRGVEHLRRVAENLEKMSRTLHEEMDTIRGSGDRVAERLAQVSDRMDERIEEFNALMEVIQDEAEGIFVETASTARGVRRGIGRLADGPRGRRAVRGRGVARRTRAAREEGASGAGASPGGAATPDASSPSTPRPDPPVETRPTDRSGESATGEPGGEPPS